MVDFFNLDAPAPKGGEVLISPTQRAELAGKENLPPTDALSDNRDKPAELSKDPAPTVPQTPETVTSETTPPAPTSTEKDAAAATPEVIRSTNTPTTPVNVDLIGQPAQGDFGPIRPPLSDLNNFRSTEATDPGELLTGDEFPATSVANSIISGNTRQGGPFNALFDVQYFREGFSDLVRGDPFAGLKDSENDIFGSNRPPKFVGFPDPDPPGTPTGPESPPAPELPANFSLGGIYLDNQTISFDVRSGFTDPDGDPLTYSAIDLPNGLGFDPNTGLITGTLDIDASQIDRDQLGKGFYVIPLSVIDSGGLVAEGNWVIQVLNPSPDLDDGPFVVPEDGVLEIDIFAATTDEDPVTVTQINGQPAVEGQPIVVSEGTYTLLQNGILQFMPNADFNGGGNLISVSVTVQDADGASTSKPLSIQITPEQDAFDDNSIGGKNFSQFIDPLANDQFEGNNPTITAVNGTPISTGQFIAVSNGTVGLLNDGTLVFTPDTDFVGPTNFTYTVNTDLGTPEIATVFIEVLDLENDFGDVIEDGGTATLDLVSNDPFSGPTITEINGTAVSPGDTVTITEGTIFIQPPSSPSDPITTVIFTPNPDYNSGLGFVQFTYTAEDSSNNSYGGAVNISVAPETDAFEDTFVTIEDTPVLIDALDNDGFEGVGLEITKINGVNITSIPSGLIDVENGNGDVIGQARVVLDSGVQKIEFIPDPDYNTATQVIGSGPQDLIPVFTYSANTSLGTEESTTIRGLIEPAVDIVPDIDDPFGQNDSIDVPEDAVDFPLNVLGNDTFSSPVTISAINGTPIADGDIITLANGTITFSGGQLLFTPNPDYNTSIDGPVTFTYSVTTQNGLTEGPANVEVNVTPVADIVDDTFTTSEDTPKTFNTDPDAGTNNDNFEGTGYEILSIITQEFDGSSLVEVETLISNNAGPIDIYDATGVTVIGTVTVNTAVPGELTFTPAPDYHTDGQPTILFDYTATTDEGTPERATITGTITPDNNGTGGGGDPDDAIDDVFSTLEDTVVEVNILQNDQFEGSPVTVTEINGTPISVGQSVGVTNGSVTLLANGNIEFEPSSGYTGPITFTYTAKTPVGIPEVATVNGVVVGDDIFTIAEDSNGNILPVLANDPLNGTTTITSVTFDDGGPQTVTFTGVGDSATLPGGVLTLDDNGGTSPQYLLFTPTTDFNGIQEFTYEITNGTVTQGGIPVVVRVTPVVDGVEFKYDAEGNGATPDDDLPASVTVDEDSGPLTVNDIRVGLTDVVNNTLLDTDGSESATTIIISLRDANGGNVSDVYNLAYTGPNTFDNLVVNGDGTISITLTLNAGSPEAILSGIQLTPPEDSDVDTTLVVSVPVTDVAADPVTNPTATDVTEIFLAEVPVIVAAVADQPSIDSVPSSPITLSIGQTAAVPLLVSPSKDDVSDTNDTFGSETLTNVISNIPPGTIILVDGQPISLVADPVNIGNFQTPPLTEAQIEDISIEFSSSASGGTYLLTLTATSTETPTEVGPGQVSVPSSLVTDTFTVVYTPYAVNPVRGDEDTAIPLDIQQSAVNPEITSLTIDGLDSGYTLLFTGDPSSTANVTFTPSNPANYSVSGGGDGSYTSTSPGESITISSPDPADIAAFIDSLAIQGPLHSDVNTTLDITVTVGGTPETFNNVDVAINVVAEDIDLVVGDDPSTSGPTGIDSETGTDIEGTLVEDVWSPVFISAEIPDIDGSENIRQLRVRNLPPGTKLAVRDSNDVIRELTPDNINNQGQPIFNINPGELLPGESLQFLGVSGSYTNFGEETNDPNNFFNQEGAVKLEGNIYILLPEDFPAGSGTSVNDLGIRFTVQNRDTSTEGANAANSALDSINTSTNNTNTELLNDNLVPVTDPVIDDLEIDTDEDTRVDVDVTQILKDQDGSEEFVGDLIIRGPVIPGTGDPGQNIPDDTESLADLVATGTTFYVGGNPVTPVDNGNGLELVLTPAEAATLQILPPEDSDKDFFISVTGANQDKPPAITTDANIGTDAELLNFAVNINITVNAVIDGVTLQASTAPGPEQAIINPDGNPGTNDDVPAGSRADVVITMNDIDGSEQVQDIRISNFPPGAEIVDTSGNRIGQREGNDYVLFKASGGVNNPWDFQGGEEFYAVWVDRNNSRDFNYTLRVATAETLPNGDIETNLTDNVAISTIDLTATIEPVLDGGVFKVTDTVAQEDPSQPIPLNVFASRIDKDGSEVAKDDLVTVSLYDNVIRDGNDQPILDINGDPQGDLVTGFRVFVKNVEYFEVSPGVFELPTAALTGIRVLPPENFSTALNGDILVRVETTLIDIDNDSLVGNPGATSPSPDAENTRADGPLGVEQDLEAFLNLTIEGVADPAQIISQVTVAEDSVIALSSIVPVPVSGDSNSVDQDGSETTTGFIRVLDLPSGWTIEGVSIVSGRYIFDLDQVNTINIIPAEHISGGFLLPVTLISTEADGDENIQTTNVVINITPVLDPITIGQPKTLVEDNNDDGDGVNGFQNLGITTNLGGNPDPLLEFVDLDGSETIAFFEITSFSPIGAILQLGPGEPVTIGSQIPLNRIGDLEVKLPAHSNQDFEISFATDQTDTASTGVDTTPFTIDLVFPVDGQADLGAWFDSDSDNIPDDESPGYDPSVDLWNLPDVVINGGNPSFNLNPGFVDTDGSETHSIFLENVPDGWNPIVPNGGPQPVYVGDNKWYLGPDLSEPIADQFDYLETVTIQRDQGSPNSADIVAVAVSVENDGDSAISRSEFEVRIPANNTNLPNLPDPDTEIVYPNGETQFTGIEDTTIPVTISVTDPGATVPATTVTTIIIRNLDPEFSLSNGTFYAAGVVTDPGNQTDLDDGFWVINVTSFGPQVFDIIPPEDLSGNVTFDYEVTFAAPGFITSTGTDPVNGSTVAAQFTPDPDVPDIDVTVDGNPTLEISEDTTSTVAVTLTSTDEDTDSAEGTETFENIFLSWDYIASPSNTLTPFGGTVELPGNPNNIDLTSRTLDPQKGYPITEAELQQLLVTPEFHDNGVINFTVTYDVRDSNTDIPLDEVATDQTYDFIVNIVGVVDVTTAVFIDNDGDTVTQDEDDVDFISARVEIPVANQIDIDGSESVFYIYKLELQNNSGNPVDFLMDQGTNLGNGEWRLTAAEAAVAQVKVPDNGAANFNLEITPEIREDDGDIATLTTLTKVINIGSLPDEAELIVPDVETLEDTVDIEFPIRIGLNDIDGSESYDLEISGLPSGFTVTLNGQTETESGGVVSFMGLTPAEAQSVENNLEVNTPDHYSGEFTVSVQVTTNDLDANPPVPPATTAPVVATFTVLPQVETGDFAPANFDITIDDDDNQVGPYIRDVDLDFDFTNPGNLDADETYTLNLTGVPNGFTIVRVENNVETETYTPTLGFITIDNLSLADVQSLLDTANTNDKLQVKIPVDYRGTANLTYALTALDDGGSAGVDVKVIATTTQAVTLAAISNAPTLTANGPTSLSVDENNSVALGSVSYALTDPQEELGDIQIVSITGPVVSPEAEIIITTNSGTLYSGPLSGFTATTVPAADTNSVSITADAPGSYSLTLQGSSVDGANTANPGAPATTDLIYTVTVNPISEVPNLSASDKTITEDVEDSFDINYSLADQQEILQPLLVTDVTVPAGSPNTIFIIKSGGSELFNGTKADFDSLPGGNLSIAATDVPGLTLQADRPGAYTFTYEGASQDGAAPPASTGSQTLTITVDGVSAAPVLSGTANLTGDVGDSIDFNLNYALADQEETLSDLALTLNIDGSSLTADPTLIISAGNTVLFNDLASNFTSLDIDPSDVASLNIQSDSEAVINLSYSGSSVESGAAAAISNFGQTVTVDV